jgi:predicted DsbA family dithiol-disulfide isomerase
MTEAEAEAVAGSVHATLTEAAGREGLAYHPETAIPVSTFDAHRMVHLAAEHDVAELAVKRLQEAHLAEGLPIGDPETLAALIAGVGVDLDEARSVALGEEYGDAVLEDRDRASGSPGCRSFSSTNGTPSRAPSRRDGCSRPCGTAGPRSACRKREREPER